MKLVYCVEYVKSCAMCAWGCHFCNFGFIEEDYAKELKRKNGR